MQDGAAKSLDRVERGAGIEVLEQNLTSTRERCGQGDLRECIDME